MAIRYISPPKPKRVKREKSRKNASLRIHAEFQVEDEFDDFQIPDVAMGAPRE